MTFADQAEAAGRALLAEPLPLPPPKKIRARFRARITGRFGKGGKRAPATVFIDRALTFHVRAYKGRKLRSLPLEVVAAWAFQKLAESEARQTRARRRRRAS